MARPSRAAVAELFWHFSNKSPDGWFGHLLGLRLPRFGGHLDIRQVDAASSEIASTVPAWLCGQDGRVGLAGAVALFDEISTFGGVVPWDQGWRPGASVQMSAQAFRPLDVGYALASAQVSESLCLSRTCPDQSLLCAGPERVWYSRRSKESSGRRSLLLTLTLKPTAACRWPSLGTSNSSQWAY